MVSNLFRKSFGVRYSVVIRSKKKKLSPNRFGVHRLYKFTKFHKLVGHGSPTCIMSDVVSASSFHASGRLVRVVARSPNFQYLTNFNIKACQNLIRKPYKRFIRSYVYTFLGVTKKPAEVRMGKGKGSKVSHHVFPVQSGSRLFTSPRRMNTRTSDLRLGAKLQTCVAKFPITCSTQIGSF